MFGDKNPAVGRKVIVNLVGGNAIEGVMTSWGKDCALVHGATLHEVGADTPVRLDGEVLVDRINIDFIQLTGTG